MFDMKKVIIIIPAYKPFDKLTQNELCSLRQLQRILPTFPVCIFAPENLPLEKYIDFFGDQPISTEFFKNENFRSIRSYNKLHLSKDFFKRFLGYDYLLLYHTDAYVFRNELKLWMDQGYDYIGAPFYKNNREPFNIETWSVGNGGFSLRGVKKSYKLSKKIELYGLLFKLLAKIRCKTFVVKLSVFMGIKKLAIMEKIAANKINEDVVFSTLATQFIRNFRVPSIEVAWKFSFEAHPALLYKLNNNELPFGCHGWDKYEPEFWKNFINVPESISLKAD
jgi:hypothetical protein